MIDPLSTRISVIIPSVVAETPDRLREALSNQSLAPHEIIHVHDADRRGAAWARNRGIEKASGEIVACIDDDCIPPSDWLESISDAMARFGADVVGGTYEEHDPFLRARRQRQAFPTKTGPDKEGMVGAGGNIAYRMRILEALRQRDGHVFNEAFRISQDWELMWRLRGNGARVVFLATQVLHLKRLGPLSYLKQQFSRGIGIAGLDRLRQRLGSGIVTHRSLLWGKTDIPKWRLQLTILWRKGIGPFDLHSFSSMTQFALFWIGEKVQAAGYLWGKSRGPLHS
jgi:glycosyltransferase involved in cell wall biosynthesis